MGVCDWQGGIWESVIGRGVGGSAVIGRCMYGGL